MLVGAGLQRRRRQLQQPQQPRRRQPLLWPMNADPPPPPPPPWVWMVPGSAGLLRLGAGVAPPPGLLASAQPSAAPLLPGLPGWLPLLPLPSAPDHAAAAAVHHYPLLNGQVMCSPAPGPGFGVAGFPPGPWARPSPRSGGSGPVACALSSRGGPRLPSPSRRSLAAMHRQQSSCFDVSFCLSAVFAVCLPGFSDEQFGDPHPKPRVGTALATTFARAGVVVQSAVLKYRLRSPALQLPTVADLPNRS